MNVIFIVSRDNWDHYSSAAMDMARYMRDHGHEVNVVTRNLDNMRTPWREAGFDTFAAPLRGGFDVISPVRIARRLAEGGRVVIHVQTFRDAAIADKARMLSANRNVKIVITVRPSHPARLTAAHNAVYRAIDRFVFPSQAAHDLFFSSQPSIDPSKVSILTEVPAPPMRRIPVTAVSGDDKYTLIMCCTDPSEQHLDTALGMMKQLSRQPLRMIVIGATDTPAMEEMVQLSKRAGLGSRIDWRGETPNADTVIDKADIALTLNRNPASGGTEILRYMLHGVPVVAPEEGVADEIITTGDLGVRVAPDNVYGVSQAVLDLIADKPRRIAIGEASRRHVRDRFPFDTYADSLIAIMNGLS